MLSLAALAAGWEAGDPAAVAAARAACLAASSAYMHPLADVEQTKHIVGPAAYAALALELNLAGDPEVGDRVVRWAVACAPPEVSALLRQMPARQPGGSDWPGCCLRWMQGSGKNPADPAFFA